MGGISEQRRENWGLLTYPAAMVPCLIYRQGRNDAMGTDNPFHKERQIFTKAG